MSLYHAATAMSRINLKIGNAFVEQIIVSAVGAIIVVLVARLLT